MDMELQILIKALNNPYESLCFLFGGGMTLSGFFLAALMPDGQWKNKGLILMFSGSIIASPAIFPFVIAYISQGNDLADTFPPTWILNLIALLGALIGFTGWIAETKKAKKICKR